MRFSALRRLAPTSKLGWTLAVLAVLAWPVVLAQIAYVLAPTVTTWNTLGGHDWDQMETHRELVVKTMLDYHQFPFWEPYACGGHPNWGGFESGSMIVSPWLPAYLWAPLPHALRVEVWGSALISAVGTWLFAGRFSRSPAARALAVVVFAVSGRWALQITQGHTWHLSYEWTPWALYFYDRAVGADPSRGPPRLRDLVLCGASIAMMVYTGGIYPLPESVFVIAVYGLLLAATMRSARPVLVGLACGAFAFGLSAPKLLPMLEVMMRFPRLIESREVADLQGLIEILTSQDQDATSSHAGVNQWGWHEWGMYVGWTVVALLIVGCLVARGTRESPLKWTGLLCFVLGLGAFDPHAPWTLLHKMPVFSTQHVPSRWMYPGLLLLVVVSGAAFDRVVRRTGWARAWIEMAALAGVAWIALDVGKVAREPVRHMFYEAMPHVADSTGPFRTEEHMPASLGAQMDWSPPSLPAVLANIGTIDCGTFPPFHNYWRHPGPNGIPAPGMGARSIGDREYHGEAFIAEGTGTASIVKWTPNEMTVQVHGAKPGDHVLLNQNWDPGWSANGSRAIDWADLPAAEVHAPDDTIVFRYRPRTLWLSLLVFALTVGGIGRAWYMRRRRWRSSSKPSSISSQSPTATSSHGSLRSPASPSSTSSA